MTLASWSLLLGLSLILLILVQAGFVAYYIRQAQADAGRKRTRNYQPPVTVLLCLRGRDPELGSCLGALLQQEYPDYRLVCILDSPHDPAHDVLANFLQDPRLTVKFAFPAAANRSLKCNSLLHALPAVQDPVTVLVDADTLVDAHWLSDLVAPLEDGQTVASSGNRWFLPADRNLGSLIRYFWNMAAAPQMFVYQVTWGGSLALKTDFVHESGLLEAWSRSLFEDAMVPAFARRAGKSVAMVPSLLIPNRESITFVGAFQWVGRQLLDTRLYHRCFPLVLGHALLVALTLLATLVTLAVLIWQGLQDPIAFAVLFACLMLYGIFYAWAWWTLDGTARQALEQRGHALDAPLRMGWRCLAVIALTQAVYTLATFHALWRRRVKWRGIRYLLHGPFDIRMGKYREMETPASSGSQSI